MIAPHALAEARRSAQECRRRTVDVLEERLGLPAPAFVAALGAHARMAPIEVEALGRHAAAFDVVPLAECAEHGCALLRDEGGRLLLATDDPFAVELPAWAVERIGRPFQWRLVHRVELAAWVAAHEESVTTHDALRPGGAGSAEDPADDDLGLEVIRAEPNPVVRLVRSVLRDALRQQASDVHLESVPGGLDVKFRIDGLLARARTLTGRREAEQAIARVKILAELDITERRVPQDGRFKARADGRTVDFRVSIMPSIHGEDAVLRVLDKRPLHEESGAALSLERLGFEPEIVSALRRFALAPHGMLLVTGPTGSGKTTTLYAALSEINDGREKIVTIEDPVEYRLAGVLQIPVNEKKGLGFARGLRSILRHDPDRIMVGEIRDPETAVIAVQSALTGHMVFTTVHANNVFDVVGRFMHMGVDLHGLASALNVILAQRLVRVACPACRARGCTACRGSGYRGRKAIAELLVVDDTLRELIASRAPLGALKEAARARGTRSLREAAIGLLARAETTAEEIDRVTFSA